MSTLVKKPYWINRKKKAVHLIAGKNISSKKKKKKKRNEDLLYGSLILLAKEQLMVDSLTAEKLQLSATKKKV